MNEIYLGTNDSERIYLTKHKWDCSWYWSFGYLGNRNCHYHFESYLNKQEPFTDAKIDTYDITKVFDSTWITQSQWWILLDLFKQAYSLKEAAATYRHGGYMSSLKGITDILKNPDKEKQCNSDLELLLNTTWNYIVKIKGEYESLNTIYNELTE